MARIERYNRIDKPDVEDIVIGTDRDDDNQTKNFRLGDILALAEGVDLNFIGLEDTPSTYENSAGKIPVVRFEEQGLIFKDPSEVFEVGALTFLELTDTPADYTGQQFKVVRVTKDEDAVEFYDLESVISVIQNEINQLENSVEGNSQAIAELENTASQIQIQIKSIESDLNNKIDDAPSDGKEYVRKDGSWVEIDLSNYVLSGDLADVATSGSYTDLINKPELPNTDSNTQSVSGTYNIDWNEYSNWDLTLTGNTTLTQSNIPPTATEKTITIHVQGNYALTLPTEWEIKNGGVYDGINGSQIVVQSWDNGEFYTVIN